MLTARNTASVVQARMSSEKAEMLSSEERKTQVQGEEQTKAPEQKTEQEGGSSGMMARRRDSLEKQLQTRPEPRDLKERHILLDTTAAP